MAHPNHQLDLTSTTPAKSWATESLPLGNGYFGALVLGGVAEDRIRFTDPLLRDDAGRLQPLAELVVATGHEAANARTFLRRLDLQTGSVEVSYRDGRLRQRREYFTSHPDRVFVGKLRSIRKRSLNLTLSWESIHEEGKTEFDPETKRYAVAGNGFGAVVEVRLKGGEMVAKDGQLKILGADEVALLLTLSRGETFSASAHLDSLRDDEAGAIFQRHLPDYQDQFHSMYITLEGGSKSHMETSKRRLLYQEKPEEDPGFEELLFQYGRYLNLSSVREGGLASSDWWFQKPLADEGASVGARVSQLFTEADGGRADNAYAHLRGLLQTSLTDNLLFTNQNVAANRELVPGVRQLFAKEEEGVLHLGDNLPSTWSNGSVVGFRTANYEVAYVWQSGQFFEGYLTRLSDGEAAVKANGRLLLDRPGDETVTRLEADAEGCVRFPMTAEKTMRLRAPDDDDGWGAPSE